MKKIVLFLLVISSLVYGKINTVVSILPQKTFVEAIGGDKINTILMVKPGTSPHTYEPKPSQMRDVSKADIYFAIDGLEFEQVWLHKFEDINKRMKVVNTAKGIKKIEMEAHSHGEEEHHDEHKEDLKHDNHGDEKHDDHDEHAKHDDHDDHDEHKHEGLDPHVWLSPENVKVLAKNILDGLVAIDRGNEAYYKANYKKFISKIEKTDKTIKNILKDTPEDSTFMVFHPAWGYFAHVYELEQVSIEVEGKSPKPKQIAHIIEEAKEEKVKAIFTAPEFSDNVANQIAKELNIKVIKVSPLSPNWSQNLINFAKAIANK